jgi:hypothetical protein
VTGRGGRGGFLPETGGVDFAELAETLAGEAMGAAREKRSRAGERFAWERRDRQRALGPQLGTAPRRGRGMDPMRYAQTHGQAARHGQMARGGFDPYGIGEMAAKHEEERAREQAFASYPMYFQAMMGG